MTYQSVVIDFASENFYWILSIGTLLLAIGTSYVWTRRWLYYHGSKIPGPLGLPFLGSVHLLEGGPRGVYKFLNTLYAKYPSIFKIWLGPDLYVSTTDPKHLKTILTGFLDKGNFYQLMSEYFQRALAASAVEPWKKNRKNVNPTFNVSLINSFVGKFTKHANRLVDDLDETCGEETEDLFPVIWKCTLDAACETLAEVDPVLVKSEEFLPGIFRIEEILLQRFFSPFFHLNIIWKFSSLKRELIKLWKNNCFFIQKLIDIMKVSQLNTDRDSDSEDGSPKKRFLNHLIDLSNKKIVSSDYVLEEAQIMFFVGTETSAVALSSTLLVLGMYPEVQKKIDEELFSIFGHSDREPTLEDAVRMEYLERVIKETLRLFPPIPFIMRQLDEDLKIDDYTFPAGAKVIIPIPIVHRKPELYPDPLKFDPDRFLPEEIEKRPPCSYLPFSYGVRNCIGYKYGMLSMKVILSSILRRYRIQSSNYKKLEDIDLLVHVVAKAKEGYKITLQRKSE